MGKKNNAYGILVGKPEGSRWIIIKSILREIGRGGVDWTWLRIKTSE
jgi:hypothetical protein